jgi:ADP-ribosylglycohydrolase
MDAAAAVALAARYASATRGLPLNPEHFIEFVASGVQAGNKDSKLPGFIRELLQLKQCSFDEAAARTTEIGIKENNERIWPDAEPGINCISVGPWQTTLWALWCFLTNSDSYIGCVATAIAAGGDVDTTAAIAGGIAGARLGAAGERAYWVPPCFAAAAKLVLLCVSVSLLCLDCTIYGVVWIIA